MDNLFIIKKQTKPEIKTNFYLMLGDAEIFTDNKERATRFSFQEALSIRKEEETIERYLTHEEELAY